MKTLAIAVIILGIIALPTPAPGWLIIFSGVKMLKASSQEEVNLLVQACNRFEM